MWNFEPALAVAGLSKQSAPKIALAVSLDENFITVSIVIGSICSPDR